MASPTSSMYVNSNFKILFIVWVSKAEFLNCNSLVFKQQ